MLPFGFRRRHIEGDRNPPGSPNTVQCCHVVNTGGDEEGARVESALRPLLEHDDFGVVYLVNGDQGYVVITWGYSLESGGREGLVDEIYLRQRGQGIGAWVMQALFEELRGRGVIKMFLETERHNARARTFYARQGFEADDSIWMSRPFEN